MSDLYQRISNLSPEQRELLVERLVNSDQLEWKQHIPTAGTTALAPLSFAQERLWFLGQLTPDNPFYNVPAAIRLIGPLNASALESALSEIMRRHQVLRTTFDTADGRPVQRISHVWPSQVPLVDLGHLQEHEREPLARGLAGEEALKPFDLSRGPILRSAILRLGRHDTLLLLTIHHIATDGWSIGILMREFGAIYEHFLSGQPSSLLELPIQYGDFARWQREWLQGEVLESQMAYWKRQLAGSLTSLKIATDRPRPAVQRYRGARQSFDLPQAVSDALKTMCRREEVTLFILLLASFQALLYRYTGQDDVLVGTAIAGRNRTEVERLIGFFVSTLVLRVGFSGRQTFRELLRKVRGVVHEAYANQDLPFEKLVEELRPERDLSRSPLFEVMFILHNAPAPLAMRGLGVAPLEVETGSSKFDLTLEMGEEGNRILGSFRYDTDLYDASTIIRLLDNFVIMLEAIIANPDKQVAMLRLLTKAESSQLRVQWNDTRTDDVVEQCLHRLIVDQVQRAPAAVAVAFNGEHLTYCELGDRANRLASYLRTLGVGPEALVGVYLGRSLDLVIGLLAILRSGGAYLPLDPTYPVERLTHMMDDSGAKVFLTERRLAGNLQISAASIVCMDENLDGCRARALQHSVSQVHADNSVYVIYTSGSTGGPKGVQIPQGAVVNFLNCFRRELEITAADRLLALTTFSFDIAGLELFLPLVTGATIILASREAAVDGTQLAETLARYDATMMQATPATWRLLLASGWRCPRRLKVLCGGEALPEDLARQLALCASPFWNLYGPTETTIWSTYNRLDSNFDTVSIGRPIDNTEIYLTDTNMQLVPIGNPGELFISGKGLARGYLKRAEVTSSKFVPHPFTERPGARIYRTGDVAKYLPDGRLMVLGRMDHQIKVRGYRIELEEIEAQLVCYPGVREAAVVPMEYAQGDKRLVAYLVPDQNSHRQGEPGIGLEHKYLSTWQTVWEETFSQPTAASDPTLNINGWRSSYSGEPFSEGEMRDWLDPLAERILALKPSRLLEIGCGTGLLLFRVAPHCLRYCGSDFSPAALEYIRNQLSIGGRELPQVTLRQAFADDFRGLEPKSFDAVVLNSVIQYFPGVDYLLRVLEGALSMVQPGGFIFMGDVRSISLLNMFHTSVQLHHSPMSLSVGELRRRVSQRISQEQELVLDPAFFAALRYREPEVARVEVNYKRGRCHNELTKFRYDVILRTRGELDVVPSPCWMNWQEDRLTFTELGQLLAQSQPDIFGIRNVPNARLREEVIVEQLLSQLKDDETIGALLDRLRESNVEPGVDPENIARFCEDLGYRVNIYAPGASGRFDAMLTHRDLASGFEPETVPAVAESFDRARALTTYANSPFRENLAGMLVPQLRSYLAGKLPDYMIPASFFVLEALPLMPNGKINRGVLPSLDGPRTLPVAYYVPPKTETERKIAGIWRDVLQVDKLGRHDNFFDLGGHSLLLVQVQSKLTDTFGRPVTLLDLFKYPTISTLSDYLRLQGDEASFPAQESRNRGERRVRAMYNQRQFRQSWRESGNQEAPVE